MPSDRHPAPAASTLDIREMWVALLACDWLSLAVVPTDAGAPVQKVMEPLAEVVLGQAGALRIVDARGMDVDQGRKAARELASDRESRSRSIVIVDPLTHSLAGVHLVQEVGSVLLVVRVGEMDDGALTSTVSIVGAERIAGSVAVSSFL